MGVTGNRKEICEICDFYFHMMQEADTAEKHEQLPCGMRGNCDLSGVNCNRQSAKRFAHRHVK